MIFFNVNEASVFLNPKSNPYDVSFQKERAHQLVIDNETYHKVLNTLPESLPNLPKSFYFSDGVKPRDLICIPSLSSLGIVCSERMFKEIQKLNIPPNRSSATSINYKGNQLIYHWLVFNPQSAMSKIETELSLFSRGDDYWGKEDVQFSSVEDLINQLKNQQPVRGAIRFSKLILSNDFNYDLFRLPRLSTRFYCSENFKKMFESNSFSGARFQSAKVFLSPA